MGSRIRENPDHVFECFCEVGLPSDADESALILQKYPESYNNEEILKSIPQFAYPCHFTPEAVQHFSFVLTSVDSKWTFGYCRHAPNSQTCFVMLSYLPWHDLFFKILNSLADVTNNKSIPSGDLWKFLEALYKADVPKSGMQLHVAYNLGKNEFAAQTPDDHKLPSIPENRNLMEYFSAISTNNMINLFASMLHERRILMTSRKLSKLSACVQAANLLVYPMYWQHIFIPVLPTHLMDYLSAPMPFLIGVPASTMSRVRLSEIGEVVILDADNDTIQTPFDDMEMMPAELVHNLKRGLKSQACLLGDTVSRAYLRAIVQLIGGYKEALDVQPGKKITFNKETFIKSRPPPMQPFLEKILHLQLFHQFIEGRLQALNSGQVCSDEFESEVNLYEDKSSTRFQAQYKQWAVNMKKEGGALFKSVKNKANPAMKHAYKSVKHKGRKAYKDFRTKFQETPSHHKDGLHSVGSSQVKKPHSAPASPTIPQRPFRYNPDAIPKSQTASQGLESSRHYNLLDLEDGDDSASDSNLSLDRLNLDLMSDFENIFQSCSISSGSNTLSAPVTRKELSINGATETTVKITGTITNPPPVDRRLKPQRSLERCATLPISSLLTSPSTGTVPSLLSSPGSSYVKPFPIAPPRNKRRLLNDQDAPLLINLEETQVIFDPLLEKELSEQPDLILPSNRKTLHQTKQPLTVAGIDLNIFSSPKTETKNDRLVWPPVAAVGVPHNPFGDSFSGNSWASSTPIWSTSFPSVNGTLQPQTLTPSSVQTTVSQVSTNPFLASQVGVVSRTTTTTTSTTSSTHYHGQWTRTTLQ